jgi:5-methyltetrahydrofolate--homocysteine methyltransferase
MTISADSSAAKATLKALEYIRYELGCHTSLGVSNVSFGLPNREAVNSTFFACAMERGLSAAIMNPFSAGMMKTYYTYNALHDFDENCGKYIEYITTHEEAAPVSTQAPVAKATNSEGDYGSALQKAIAKGLKDQAGLLTKEMLSSVAPLEIIQKEIIPALDIVGKGFEEKTIFLPQLLMAAEAAKSSFEEIKGFMATQGGASIDKYPIVIATVHGDIHDIGKNIVKLLLENYGFKVIDLGKDVAPEKIVEAVIENHAPVAGLSALMTTTVPAMEATIKLLNEKAPWCKVVVGGAVLNQEYSDRIGATKYAKDAMETVRFSDSIEI